MYQEEAIMKTGNDKFSDELSGMRRDAEAIIRGTIEDVLPTKAVRKALREITLERPIYVLAIGKAAWVMADEAASILGNHIVGGIVVTKYGHSKGEIPGFRIIESGHPMPDENSVMAASEVLKMADKMTENDQALILLSGGGSSLAEIPAPGLTLEDLRNVTEVLLKCGADIVEINTLRKHLSGIKGGKLAKHILPASGCAVILSDVVGNHPEMIASGPTYTDNTDADDVMEVIKKHNLNLSDNVLEVLKESRETVVCNVKNIVEGSVDELCHAASAHAAKQGYSPYIIASDIGCEAKELGERFASMGWEYLNGKSKDVRYPCAFIIGGETVVKVTGDGLGGRNQEIALYAAKGLKGLDNVVLFSLASDGTDGPTDAAGGIVDGMTVQRMEDIGMDVEQYLYNNDAYHALKSVGDLIITGPTGTNLNDVTVMLVKK